MSIYLKQEKSNLGKKNLSAFVLILSLLGTTSSYAKGNLRGSDSSDEEFGLTTQLKQTIQHVSEDEDDMLVSAFEGFHKDGLTGVVKAFVGHFVGAKLEFFNENSTRAHISFVNQRTGEEIPGMDISARERGIVHPNCDAGDLYCIQVELNNFMGSSATSAPLSLNRNFQVRLKSRLVGTTVVIEK